MSAKLDTTEKIRERNYFQVSLSSRKNEDMSVKEKNPLNCGSSSSSHSRLQCQNL